MIIRIPFVWHVYAISYDICVPPVCHFLWHLHAMYMPYALPYDIACVRIKFVLLVDVFYFRISYLWFMSVVWRMMMSCIRTILYRIYYILYYITSLYWSHLLLLFLLSDTVGILRMVVRITIYWNLWHLKMFTELMAKHLRANETSRVMKIIRLSKFWLAKKFTSC